MAELRYYNISRLLWDLERFGFTPRKLGVRLFPDENLPRILIISVPKAGTHLVERTLCLHPNLYRKFVPTLHSQNLKQFGGLRKILFSMKPGQILVSHLHYSLERLRDIQESGVYTILVVRDPRDVIISQAHYVARNQNHPYYSYMKDKDLRSRIRLTIFGQAACKLMGIRETLEHFSGWVDRTDFLLRFEELVNPETRLSVLRNLYNSLGQGTEEEIISHINNNVVSSVSPTFRRGVQGEWRQVFDDEMNSWFEQEVEQSLLAHYGYT